MVPFNFVCRIEEKGCPGSMEEYTYNRCIDNEEALFILRSVTDGYSFGDLFYDSSPLINVYNEISTILERKFDRENLLKQYGTDDLYEIYDVSIEFDPILYK